MKRKVKICMNLQCTDRVNKADAAVCAGCRSSFRGISWEYKSDEEIEAILHPELAPKEETADGEAGSGEDSSEAGSQRSAAPREIIVCPSCGAHIPYTVGLEYCECGEYVQEEIPIMEGTDGASGGMQEEISGGHQVAQATPCVKAMTTLDGTYRLEFTEAWMKIGRESVGRAYFEGAGKNKVSREHAIVQMIDGAWYLSYCKKEDRNYTGGTENPIYINGRRMDRLENYRLQVGDEIAFAELDKRDPLAAFFRVE